MCEDSVVMGWLWHSIEPHIATTVEFCDSLKKNQALDESFSQQSNVSRVHELYETILSTKQSGEPLSEYYSSLKNLWEQLLQHRPFTTDLVQQKRHLEDFMVASLLSGLDSDLRGFKDQILASDTLPSAANAYSRLLRSSLGNHSTQTSSSESSALLSDNGNYGGFRGGRAPRGGRGRGDRKCDYCGGTNHTEPYCYKKYGRPASAHQVTDSFTQATATSNVSDSVPSMSGSRDALTTQLSKLVQALRTTLPSSSSAKLASKSNIACVAQSSPSWIIDSGATSHMSGGWLFSSRSWISRRRRRLVRVMRRMGSIIWILIPYHLLCHPL